MGYNYATAFRGLTKDDKIVIREATIVAVMNYRTEFPETSQANATVYMSDPCIEITGGPEPRVYTFEELGFKI